jgi:hypothetical protein
MRTLCLALAVSFAVGAVSTAAWAAEAAKAKGAGMGTYDSCQEQLYDPIDEPCGGGHQHVPGKRDEASLDLSRHRHRYLEERIRKLNEKVDKLAKEVAELKKAK